MWRWLCRLFRRPRVTRPVVPVVPVVGVVCHRLEDRDVAALRAMGVMHVRLSLYPDGDGAQWIDRAVAEGFDVLAVTYRPAQLAEDRQRWPGVRWQAGNEPDWHALGPAQVAAVGAVGDVTPGLAHGTPREWIQAYRRMLPPGQVLALHAYGDDLTVVLAELAASAAPPCWLTEIGHSDPARLLAGLRAIDGTRFARAYVYALYSPIDGYTLGPGHQAAIRGVIGGTAR